MFFALKKGLFHVQLEKNIELVIYVDLNVKITLQVFMLTNNPINYFLAKSTFLN